jgi:hypothetical protein
MRKVIAFLLLLTLLIGGIILANNITEQPTEEQAESEVKAEQKLNPNLPPLHYFRQDRYPTKEELPHFHIFKGQFPLENINGDIELHNFNE